jgi:hypothetical protein
VDRCCSVRAPSRIFRKNHSGLFFTITPVPLFAFPLRKSSSSFRLAARFASHLALASDSTICHLVSTGSDAADRAILADEPTDDLDDSVGVAPRSASRSRFSSSC